MPTPPALDRRLYRAALSLCPAGFRRDHGDEMARDFDEACAEAADGGGLRTLRLLMAIDLARTFVVQWSRSGLPVIGLAAVCLSLAVTEGLATVARRATFHIPDDAAHAEIVGVLLLAVIAVLLVALTIALNVWANRPRRLRRR